MYSKCTENVLQVFGQKSFEENVLFHLYLLLPRGYSPINSFYIIIDCSEMLSRSKCQHISCCSKMFIYLHASTILTQIKMCTIILLNNSKELLSYYDPAYIMADLFYTRCRFLLISSCSFARINN